MTIPIITAHVLVFQKDKVLLVRHGVSAGHLTGVYGIPGGHLNGDETLKHAAIRVLHEETGLEVDEKDLQDFPSNKYTADIQRKDGSTKRYTMTVFTSMSFGGLLNKTSETTPEWIEFSKLDEYNLLPNVKEA